MADNLEQILFRFAWFSNPSASLMKRGTHQSISVRYMRAPHGREVSELWRGRLSAGRTPLHYAAMHGRVAALKELVGGGAALEVADTRGGFCPLHLAADAGQCEAVAALAGLGACVEARTAKGWTPLVLATMKVRLIWNDILPTRTAFGHCASAVLADADSFAGQAVQAARIYR